MQSITNGTGSVSSAAAREQTIYTVVKSDDVVLYQQQAIENSKQRTNAVGTLMAAVTRLPDAQVVTS